MSTILVDGNNVGIAALYAPGVQELHDFNGEPVGVVFAFLRMVKAMLEQVETIRPGDKHKLCVLWDSSNSWRYDLLPSYKHSRKERSDPEKEALMESYFKQVPKLQAILPNLGIGQMKATRMEADDIAGHVVRSMPNTNIVLMSGDGDWLQLIRRNVICWQPSQARFVDLDNFEEITGCEDPAMFSEMKAIIGDKGDDIPGCKGVGDTTAIRYLKGTLDKLKDGSPSKKELAIAAHMTDPGGYALTKRLTDLRGIVIPNDAWQLARGSFDAQAFMDQVAQYGFKSIHDHFNDWTAPFSRLAS